MLHLCSEEVSENNDLFSETFNTRNVITGFLSRSNSPVGGVVVRRVPRRQRRDQPGDLLPHRLVEVLKRRRLVHREDQGDPEEHRGVLLGRQEVHFLGELK